MDPPRTIIATYSGGTTAKTILEQTELSRVNQYIIDRLHFHSENQDAQSCIALIEEFGDWLDQEIN